MSTTATNLDNLTEDEALALFRNLQQKFNWVGTVMTLNDVHVTYVDVNGDYTEDGDLDDLTPAMRDAVTDHYGWRHASDAMAEAGNRSIPSVTLFPDGSFDLDAGTEW